MGEPGGGGYVEGICNETTDQVGRLPALG